MNISKYCMLFLLILNSILFGEQGIPEKPESWVSDYTGTLSSHEKATLDSMLDSLEKRSSNQIFVAIFNELPENYYLEDFAVKLYDQWQPGLEKQDNGILIVVFIKDRKIRIEVGYGLEDVVTDAQSGVIIRQYIAPNFREENYFQGIKSGLDILIPTVEGKYKIPLQKKPEGNGSSFTIFFIIIALLIMLHFWGKNRPTGIGSKKHRRYYGLPTALGGGFGGFGGGLRGGGGHGGGGFGGGFGGMSGGGGASGGW